MKNNIFENLNIPDATATAISRTVCDKKLTSDLSGEYTLPDHLPEMRKLIRVSITPTAPSKFISSGSVQFGGGADYSVCYVGADGKLYSATFPTEYSFNAAFDPDAEYDVDEGLFAAADVYADSVVGRVIGARKLGLKARLAAKILTLGTTRDRRAEWASEPIHSETQKLTKKAECFKHLVGSNDEITVRDTVDGSSDGVRFISADCSAFLEEIRGGEGYVDCRGSVKVKYLMRKESELQPYVVEKRYTLSETVELEGMSEGALCTAFCVCTGTDAATGVDGEVEVTLHLRIVAQGFVGETMSYVSDAYSTDYDTECERKTLRLPVVNCCGTRNITFDAALPFEKLGSMAGKANVSVISVAASASVDELEFSENGKKAAAVGNVTFNMIYSSIGDDGAEELSAAEAELPFRVEGCEAKGQGKMSLCAATAFDPRAKVGAGELVLGCELAVSCAATSEIALESVSDVNILGEKSDKRMGITVCYPGNEDSLWTVAKKYRVLADRIKRENGISDEFDHDDKKSLENVKYLIV